MNPNPTLMRMIPKIYKSEKRKEEKTLVITSITFFKQYSYIINQY